jgi:thioredoxin-related protein
MSCLKNILLPFLLAVLLTGCGKPSSGITTNSVNPQGSKLSQNTKDNSIVFEENIKNAKEKAVLEGKPQLLFFTLPDCLNSKRMRETVFSQPEIRQLADRFVCVHINGATETEICQSLNVKAFPTIILLNPQGIEVQRLSGLPTTDQLALQMHCVIQTTAIRNGITAR